MQFGLAFQNAATLQPSLPNSDLYGALVHAAKGSQFNRGAMGSSERPKGFRLSHNGSLDEGKHRAYAYLRVNVPGGRSVAILTNVRPVDVPTVGGKSVMQLVEQMNNEVEGYLK